MSLVSLTMSLLGSKLKGSMCYCNAIYLCITFIYSTLQYVLKWQTPTNRSCDMLKKHLSQLKLIWKQAFENFYGFHNKFYSVKHLLAMLFYGQKNDVDYNFFITKARLLWQQYVCCTLWRKYMKLGCQSQWGRMMAVCFKEQPVQQPICNSNC